MNEMSGVGGISSGGRESREPHDRGDLGNGPVCEKRWREEDPLGTERSLWEGGP